MYKMPDYISVHDFNLWLTGFMAALKRTPNKHEMGQIYEVLQKVSGPCADIIKKNILRQFVKLKYLPLIK